MVFVEASCETSPESPKPPAYGQRGKLNHLLKELCFSRIFLSGNRFHYRTSLYFSQGPPKYLSDVSQKERLCASTNWGEAQVSFLVDLVKKSRAIPGFPGGSVNYQGHLFSLKGHLLWMDEIRSHHPRNPRMMRFPCKYQQTFWFQPWFQSVRNGVRNHPHHVCALTHFGGKNRPPPSRRPSARARAFARAPAALGSLEASVHISLLDRSFTGTWASTHQAAQMEACALDPLKKNTWPARPHVVLLCFAFFVFLCFFVWRGGG